MSISYDLAYFLIHVNDMPYMGGRVNSGDRIRVSTNYRRNFFVNSKPIGIFDKSDDAMYQNVYCIVPDNNSGDIRIILKDDLGGDVLPYSVADVNILCPDGWHFFGCSSYPDRNDYSIATFQEKERLWELSATIIEHKKGIRFKVLRSLDDFDGFSDVCGIVADGKGYTFVIVDEDGHVGASHFDKFSELSDYVLLRFLRKG